MTNRRSRGRRRGGRRPPTPSLFAGRKLRPCSPVDILRTQKSTLVDPYNYLDTWDIILVYPCTWNFVRCSPMLEVIRIDIGNKGLSGNVVPELGSLQSLQYLSMYSNNLTGPIPLELGNMMSLKSLDLSSNMITGSIPYSLGLLKKLIFLRLENNRLTGTIPATLTHISCLAVLHLSNNLLEGRVPNNGSFKAFTYTSFKNNVNLCGISVGKKCN